MTLKNLNIHGLAAGGIHAGRLTDWTVENVRIAGNGWVGWDGDIDGNDANTGTLSFKKWPCLVCQKEHISPINRASNGQDFYPVRDIEPSLRHCSLPAPGISRGRKTYDWKTNS